MNNSNLGFLGLFCKRRADLLNASKEMFSLAALIVNSRCSKKTAFLALLMLLFKSRCKVIETNL